MQHDTSTALIRRAEQTIPGGVNSPVRAFKGVGGDPVFFTAGVGARLTDVDGNNYIDYVGSWGPMLQGHAFAPVVDAVRAQAETGLGFGAPTELEVEMAEAVVQRIASIDKVRMVNSGTEATMSAIRLARGVTGRDMIVKFEGCYHGHSDSLLVKAGSGVLTLGIPNSPGVPEDIARNTITCPFNDIDAVREAFVRYGDAIACVILEPIPGNMGCIPPGDGYLAALREVTHAHDALLIFDEVMTGFRVAAGGAQELYGVEADITTLGKVIGGGLPVGAFGGRADLIDHIAPVGNVYQAGTLSGNPLAMTAGLAMLRSLDAPFYERLAGTTEVLATGLRDAAQEAGIPATVNHVPGMFSLFFTEGAVATFADVAASNVERFKQFFHGMLERGVYLAPSAFEAGFVSGAHDQAVVEETLAAARETLAEMSAEMSAETTRT